MTNTILPCVLAAACSAAVVAAPDSVCDPLLKPAAGRDGYSRRDDTRCEGHYRQDVGSASQLLLAALWDEPPPSTWDERLRLGWTSAAPSTVRIVARGLDPRDYYQMDAVLDGASSSYAWPTDIVKRSGVPTTRVGIVAFHEMPSRVYLPLSTTGAQTKSREYRAVLIAGADLTNVSAEIHEASSGGLVASKTYKPRMEFYPAASPIWLQFPAVKPGTYRITLSAQGRTERSSGALTFVMYAPS